jgi:hypothetical protein
MSSKKRKNISIFVIKDKIRTFGEEKHLVYQKGDERRKKEMIGRKIDKI